MYFDDKKEELVTKIMITEIKIEDLTKEKNIVLLDMENLDGKLQKKKDSIKEIEKEKEKLQKKEKLSSIERNAIQKLITDTFDLEDEIALIKVEKRKGKMKEIELSQLLEINEEFLERLQKEKEIIDTGGDNNDKQ